MTHTLGITSDDWSSLRSHLLQNDVEQAAMIFASAEIGAGGVHFETTEIELLQPDDFEYQSAYHISLTDDARGRIIKRAWDLRLAIVEAHSHVGRFALAEFSPSDRAGLREFVPHVRWRLKGAPYAALVVTEDAVDGLIWKSDSEPDALGYIRFGDQALASTARSIRSWRYET